jgi:hypothetical protein
MHVLDQAVGGGQRNAANVLPRGGIVSNARQYIIPRVAFYVPPFFHYSGQDFDQPEFADFGYFHRLDYNMPWRSISNADKHYIDWLGVMLWPQNILPKRLPAYIKYLTLMVK